MVGDFLSFLVGRDHKFDPVARRLYGRVLRWLRDTLPFRDVARADDHRRLTGTAAKGGDFSEIRKRPAPKRRSDR